MGGERMTGKMRDFVKGLIPGLVVAPLPYTGSEPVAYLYNGIPLPALPEWDKEAYPYAVIVQNNSSGNYLFVADDEVFTAGIDGAVGRLFPGACYRYGDGAWQPYSSGASNAKGVWSNRDIYYSDGVEEVGGTLYMEASDPVPVYE
jgi:hypothetical protein